MKTAIFAALAILAAVPAAAHTAPVIIYKGLPDRVTEAETATTAKQIEIAAEAVCEAPYLRDLKAQQLYAECLAEARAQAETALAQNALAGAEMAAR